MEKSSMKKRKQGRYLKAEAREKAQRTKNIVTASVIAVICVSILLICLLPQILPQKSVYRTLCVDGYTGTQEQLIASLVGEEMAPQGDTAYALAVENGYQKSKAEWVKTLTGAKSTDESLSTYQAAYANGYDGSLIQWLNHIAEDPDALGKSKDGNPTDYEQACENGFTGTFIEWIVSLSSEQLY